MKKNRLIAGGVAVALVAALVGLALVAGRDGGGEPAVLPVLGAGNGGAAESMVADDSSMRVAGPIQYAYAGKLPGLADEADAWKLTAGSPTVERIAELAALLGVEGEVRRSESGWTVGTDARRLDVQDVAGNPWSLYEMMAVEDAPASDLPATDPGCAADACDEPMLAPEPERPADLPDRAAAERQGRDLLARLGVDLDQATVRVDDAVTLWNVYAEPTVGGLPTVGMGTTVGIGPKGLVQYANGWLGAPEHGDTYPLIGTAAGLEKLSDESVRTLMIDPAPGAEGDVEPFVVEVTGVRLGLQLFATFERGADGYLVPSYLFATADGGEIPVIAIAEEYLAETPAHVEEPDVEEPAAPAPGEEQCTGAGAGSASESGEGTSIEANVCWPAVATVGEPVVVRVTAKGNLRDDCGSPVAIFGDAEGTAVCDIGCESLPAEPVELERTFEHTYAQPGNYDASIEFRGCGADSGTPQLVVPFLVRVEG